jgi:hypothetical protein
LCCCGSGDYDQKKKKFQSSVWRVVSFWFWRLRPEKKKVPVVCLAGWFWRLRPEKKKIPVVCLAGCTVVVLAIKTGKKKFQSSVWRVVSFLFWRLRPEKKEVPVVCLAGCAVASVFGSGDYDRKKKVPVVCLLLGQFQLELKLIQIR